MNGMFELRVNEEISLRLRNPTEDAQTYYDLICANRGRLERFLGWAHKTRDVSDTAGYLRYCVEKYELGQAIDAGIMYQGNWVGAISLTPTNPVSRCGQIGYWITEKAEGHSIVAKAANALVDYAFEVLRLNRLFIQCSTLNNRSRAVAERLGFILEGVHKECAFIDGRFHDYEVWRLLFSEWIAGRER